MQKGRFMLLKYTFTIQLMDIQFYEINNLNLNIILGRKSKLFRSQLHPARKVEKKCKFSDCSFNNYAPKQKMGSISSKNINNVMCLINALGAITVSVHE